MYDNVIVIIKVIPAVYLLIKKNILLIYLYNAIKTFTAVRVTHHHVINIKLKISYVVVHT